MAGTSPAMTLRGGRVLMKSTACDRFRMVKFARAFKMKLARQFSVVPAQAGTHNRSAADVARPM
jgi:hypothetical protein